MPQGFRSLGGVRSYLRSDRFFTSPEGLAIGGGVNLQRPRIPPLAWLYRDPTRFSVKRDFSVHDQPVACGFVARRLCTTRRRGLRLRPSRFLESRNPRSMFRSSDGYWPHCVGGVRKDATYSKKGHARFSENTSLRGYLSRRANS